jgi:hypothetical protein
MQIATKPDLLEVISSSPGSLNIKKMFHTESVRLFTHSVKNVSGSLVIAINR